MPESEKVADRGLDGTAIVPEPETSNIEGFVAKISRYAEEGMALAMQVDDANRDGASAASPKLS